MVEDLIRRARRRLLFHETLTQCAFAAAVAVGGFALLLIVGTRYMEWWVLAAIAAAGIAIGSHRVYRRSPQPYATAVTLDANAHLQDALSTAHYFSEHAIGSEAFLGAQREQAEAAARTVRLEEAVPFTMPRSLYAMAALCVLASALIGLRFGLTHGLDLRAPITSFLFEDQALKTAKKQTGRIQKSQKQWMDEAESLLSKLGMGENQKEQNQSDQESLEKALEDALESPSPANQKGASADKGGEKQEGASDQSPGDPLDNGDDANGEQNADGTKPGDKDSKASSGKNANSGSRESLLSRLKDAVSNMLKSDEGSEQSGQQAPKNDSSAGMKGQAGKGDQQKAEMQAEANGQPDADGQSGQQSQGKLNSKSDTQSGKGGSGIGSEDGSKALKEAEQLKAMGKISEIIGQRAATVSGETSIEVESGNQKLHTAYSKTTATHAETDGDVTRDEIPLALQPYVQEYFVEVRKAETAKAKPAADQQ